jgi:hypothetical protein
MDEHTMQGSRWLVILMMLAIWEAAVKHLTLLSAQTEEGRPWVSALKIAA